MAVKERDLCATLRPYLEAAGWELFEEVRRWTKDPTSPRADLVAVRDELVLVVEAKLGLGLEVMAQAEEWRPWASGVAVLVREPERVTRGSRAWGYGLRLCRERGIGVFGVRHRVEGDCPGLEVVERVDLVLDPGVNVSRLRAGCTEGHRKPGAAGRNDGGYATAFRSTCDRLRAHAEQNPGVPLPDALEAVGHHYASDKSARNHLRALIKAGKVRGLRIRRRGGRTDHLHAVPLTSE